MSTTETPTSSDAPIACSLDSDDMRSRVDDWQRLLTHVKERTPLIGGQRLAFADSLPVSELATIAAEEQRCCQFFSFRLTIDRHGVGLEVTAPPDAAPMVEMVFGP